MLISNRLLACLILLVTAFSVDSTKLFFFSTFFDSEWPDYIRVWLASMSYHPEFHWFIVTNLPERSLPYPSKLSNVHVVKSSLAEINASASAVLGYDANIRKAYKLCDFRPLFGKMFTHLITPDYTHWGYGDLDSVIGNAFDILQLRGFSHDFDVVSPMCDRVVLNGPFSIIRNSEKMNTLYLKMGNLKEKLRDSSKAWVDELLMNDIAMPMYRSGELKVYNPPGHICCSKHLPKIWAFYRGKLYAPMGRQCLYFHFGGGASEESRGFKQLFTHYMDACLLGNKDPRSQGRNNGFGFTHGSFYCFVHRMGRFQVIGMDNSYGVAFHKFTKAANYTPVDERVAGNLTLLRERDGKEVPPKLMELLVRMKKDFHSQV
jgi:hypothetical protein